MRHVGVFLLCIKKSRTFLPSLQAACKCFSNNAAKQDDSGFIFVSKQTFRPTGQYTHLLAILSA
jgi:hypothetical protein